MNTYNHFGVMLDCSRNAVMKPSEVMKFIDCLEKMGYNALELYAEDTYKINGEPYAGYMRGAYSKEEIKAIDAYAAAHGIELIPCVQTLAHFTNLVKLPQYSDIVDVNDILLIDEPRTYEFIENIFKTLSESFTSRNVNIGMDEAHMVGLGKYLDKHGYKNRFELLIKHLSRVADIAKKYGFKPHMWSDMFCRLANGGSYSVDKRIDPQALKNLPDNIELAYWDYYKTNKETYDKFFDFHKDFNRNIWFAGGAWTWTGFAPRSTHTLKTMRPAMESVISNGIKDVLITMWGDNGAECSYYAALPLLYAVKQYSEGNFDEKSIKEGFAELFGLDFDGFMLLEGPDMNFDSGLPCKHLLFSDCFLGQIDLFVQENPNIDYNKMARNIKKAGEKAGEYTYVFDSISSLCRVLEVKKNLGILTRKYYAANDKESLKALTKRYDLCIRKLKAFYNDFKTLWFKENKSFGWEVQDARLGGLACRLQSCKDIINDYVDGRLSNIDELDEPLLPFDVIRNRHYARSITYSSL